MPTETRASFYDLLSAVPEESRSRVQRLLEALTFRSEVSSSSPIQFSVDTSGHLIGTVTTSAGSKTIDFGALA